MIFIKGLDLTSFAGVISEVADSDPGKKAHFILKMGKTWQESFNAIEKVNRN